MIRPLLLGALIYGAFVFAVPGWKAAEHPMAPALIAGGALLLWLLDKLLDFGEGALKLTLELGFLAAVALGLSRFKL